MTQLDELRERRDALATEARELLENPDADLDRVTEINDELERVAERYEKISQLSRFAHEPSHVGSGSDEGPTFYQQADRNVYDLSEIRTLGVPRAGVESEMRSRALSAIEHDPSEVFTHEQRGNATAVLERNGGETGSEIARVILHTGSPEYREKFNAALSGDVVAQNELRMANRQQLGRFMTEFDTPTAAEERAAMSLTSANGGFLAPFVLDPSLILTNTGVINPIRQIAKVVQTTQNAWHGVSSAGVQAEWLSEAAQSTDASPTFAEPTVTCFKAAAYLQASFEVASDTQVANEIGMLISDAKDRLEATAFTTGNGSTQPKGFVTVLQQTTASRVAAQTNASFGAVDIFALVNNLPARYQNNCVWVAHWFLFNLARQLGGVSQPNFWVDLGPGIPSQLLGRSTYLSSAMTNAGGGVTLSTATASSDDLLVLGDFSQGYTIADRVGVQLVYQPLVIGTNFRPTGEVGWFATWRTGGDSQNADALRLLRI